MIKVLITLRDILMYVGAFAGIVMIGYVRVSFSTRQQKTSIPLDYNEKELKLRKIARIILIITVVLALIPTKYLG